MTTVLQKQVGGGIAYQHFDTFGACLKHVSATKSRVRSTVILEGVQPQSAGLLIGRIMSSGDIDCDAVLRLLTDLACDRFIA
jgi:hypothetical protein